MGYYVQMDIYNVVIPADKVSSALEAINALFAGRSEGYSWVNPPEDGRFKDIIDAFDEWRYGVQKDKSNGCIIVTEFNGQKLGDDETLWKTIAPFVSSGGEIFCRGEDGQSWKWSFKDGRLRTFSGEVIYKDIEDDEGNEKPKKPPRELSLDKRTLAIDEEPT